MNLNEFGDASQEDVHEVRQVILGNQLLLEMVCRPLDRPHRIICYWPHLANHLMAPRLLQDQLHASSSHSPTERLCQHLAGTEIKLSEICTALEKIGRNDVKQVIEHHIKDRDCYLDDDSIEKVSFEGTSLFKFMASKLDAKYWENLGRELGVKSQKLKLFGQKNNPSAGLFEVLFVEQPELKLEDFFKLTCLKDRQDIPRLFKKYKLGDALKYAINHMAERDEESLEKLYAGLNLQNPVTKNWEDVAVELGISVEEYRALDPQSPKSPTQQLLEWKCNKDPNFSVKELCEMLEKMKRNDLRQEIAKHLKQHHLYLGLT
ncbi:uncharacterized protein LOC116620261 [Nematostella vectensis]|uniref:uncharacterized protein LOC116620261 n=1 Tax=Nematostella vectensis TaxID=45351 RepID=UPI0013902BAE|nr:uncharacterized protein LOC116620261 [Nematostella vectensis]